MPTRQVADLRGIALPDADELRPMAGILDFIGRADDSTPDFKGSPYCPQKFQVAVFGEKTSWSRSCAPSPNSTTRTCSWPRAT